MRKRFDVLWMNGGIGDCAMVLPIVISYTFKEIDVFCYLVCRDKVTINFIMSFCSYNGIALRNVKLITVNNCISNIFYYRGSRNFYFLHSSYKLRYLLIVFLLKKCKVFIKEHNWLMKKWAITFNVNTHYRYLAMEMLKVEPFRFPFQRLKKENYILIYPNSGDMQKEKRVPARIFRRIMSHDHVSGNICISGHVNEQNDLYKFALDFGVSSSNIVCSNSFLFTFDLMRKASHIYTSDNGLSHIAALLDECVTVIYGPTDPLLTGVTYSNGRIVNLRGDLFDVKTNSWK